MASGSHTWRVAGFQQLLEQCSHGDCIYGPQFFLGDFLFQLHLHPKRNGWIEPGVLFLRLVSSMADPPAGALKIRASFQLPEVGWTGVLCAKSSVTRWQGGFHCEDSQGLCAALAAFPGDEFAVEAAIEVLEVTRQSNFTVRIPMDSEALKSPGPDGFFRRSSTKMCIPTREFGDLSFRADLHKNIDATGNFYVGLKLEDADPKIDEIEMQYDLCLEELGYTAKTEVLSGNRDAWSEIMGLSGNQTQCGALRSHSGPITVRLDVNVISCRWAVENWSPLRCYGLTSTDTQYLLISAAGPGVPGTPEQVDLPEFSFSNVCAENVCQMQSSLVEAGVPPENVLTVDFSGNVEEAHPQEIIQATMGDPESNANVLIYFTGHAEASSGAWCFRWRPKGQSYSAEVTVAPRDLLAWRAGAAGRLDLVVEAACAGAWCQAAEEVQLNGRVLAACAPGGLAWARGKCSVFTNWLVGQSQAVEGPQVPWEYDRPSGTGLLTDAPGANLGKKDFLRPMTGGSVASTALPSSPGGCWSPGGFSQSRSVPSSPA